jgi:hypothetical protein
VLSDVPVLVKAALMSVARVCIALVARLALFARKSTLDQQAASAPSVAKRLIDSLKEFAPWRMP